MSFWNIFSTSTESKFLNNLHETLSQKFPQTDEDKLITMACISGLLARVAYVDLEIHPNEKEQIGKTIAQWSSLSTEQAQEVSTMAISEMVSFAGLDTRDYCKPLNELLDNDDRYEVLKLLFKVAASDNNVDSGETEEIRIITKALLLEHKHFIAARASVKEDLGMLKK